MTKIAPTSPHAMPDRLGFAATARQLAQTTPESRNRVVDLFRAVSIVIVVLGHWTMAAVTVRAGIQAGNILSLAGWTHPFTWLFQVMPVFFLVGGYANALSWRSARRRGTGYGAWLRSRARRLMLPVMPVLVSWLVAGWLTLRLGFDWQTLRLASTVALMPTWFLAAYIVVTATAPAALWLWQRWHWWSVAAGLSVEKSNLGRIDVPGLTYRIDGAEIATEGPAGAGLLVWTGETDRRVRGIMADAGEERGERDEAARWLIDYLTDLGGEASAKDVKAAARAAGFAERALDRARQRAGVSTGRTGSGKAAVYVWRLDETWTPHARHARQDTSPGRHGTHGGEHDESEAQQ
jgi:hypothetical protein